MKTRNIKNIKKRTIKNKYRGGASTSNTSSREDTLRNAIRIEIVDEWRIKLSKIKDDKNKNKNERTTLRGIIDNLIKTNSILLGSFRVTRISGRAKTADYEEQVSEYIYGILKTEEDPGPTFSADEDDIRKRLTKAIFSHTIIPEQFSTLREELEVLGQASDLKVDRKATRLSENSLKGSKMLELKFALGSNFPITASQQMDAAVSKAFKRPHECQLLIPASTSYLNLVQNHKRLEQKRICLEMRRGDELLTHGLILSSAAIDNTASSTQCLFAASKHHSRLQEHQYELKRRAETGALASSLASRGEDPLVVYGDILTRSDFIPEALALKTLGKFNVNSLRPPSTLTAPRISTTGIVDMLAKDNGTGAHAGSAGHNQDSYLHYLADMSKFFIQKEDTIIGHAVGLMATVLYEYQGMKTSHYSNCLNGAGGASAFQLLSSFSPSTEAGIEEIFMNKYIDSILPKELTEDMREEIKKVAKTLMLEDAEFEIKNNPFNKPGQNKFVSSLSPVKLYLEDCKKRILSHELLSEPASVEASDEEAGGNQKGGGIIKKTKKGDCSDLKYIMNTMTLFINYIKIRFQIKETIQLIENNEKTENSSVGHALNINTDAITDSTGFMRGGASTDAPTLSFIHRAGNSLNKVLTEYEGVIEVKYLDPFKKELTRRITASPMSKIPLVIENIKTELSALRVIHKSYEQMIACETTVLTTNLTFVLGCYHDTCVSDSLWRILIMEQKCDNIQEYAPEFQMGQPTHFMDLNRFLQTKQDPLSMGVKRMLKSRSTQYCKRMIISSSMYFLDGFCCITGRAIYEHMLSDNVVIEILKQTLGLNYEKGNQELLKIMEESNVEETITEDQFRLIMAYGIYVGIKFTDNGYAKLCKCEPTEIDDEFMRNVDIMIKSNLNTNIENTLVSIIKNKKKKVSEPPGSRLNHAMGFFKRLKGVPTSSSAEDKSSSLTPPPFPLPPLSRFKEPHRPSLKPPIDPLLFEETLDKKEESQGRQNPLGSEYNSDDNKTLGDIYRQDKIRENFFGTKVDYTLNRD